MKERATYEEAYRLFTSIKVDPRFRKLGNGMTGDERELLLLLVNHVVLSWDGVELDEEQKCRLAELADDLLQRHGLSGYS
jgi:hypothetical protein